MTTHELPSGLGVRYHHVRNRRMRPVSFKMDSWGPMPVWDISPRGGQTVAQIIDLETEAVLATGASRCHPKDNYNKATGRKIALGRALKALGDRSSAFAAATSDEQRVRAAIAGKLPIGFLYRSLGEYLPRYHEGIPLKTLDLSAGVGVRVANSAEDTIKTFYLNRISDVTAID